MTKVTSGIYSIVDALQPVAGAILVLMLIIAGINAITSGADGKMKMKEDVKMLLIGSAVVFTASTIGKTIMSWFM